MLRVASPDHFPWPSEGALDLPDWPNSPADPVPSSTGSGSNKGDANLGDKTFAHEIKKSFDRPKILKTYLIFSTACKRSNSFSI